jgi:hypothetical protein
MNVTYRFTAAGHEDAERAIAGIGALMRRTYPPVRTSALANAMAGVGPSYEWAWFDHLSPGDVLRVMRLREITLAKMTPDDVHGAAMLALAEFRRVAEERMRAIPDLPPDLQSASS